MRGFGMILGAVALLAVLAAGIYGWSLRTNYVAGKLAAVTDPPDLPVGPTPASAASTAGAPRILVVGDSRVGQWLDRPQREGAVFFMRGAGGETSAGGLRRIQDEMNRFRPDVLLVMTGINDLVAASLNPEMAVSIERDLVANLIKMAKAAAKGGAEPIVATVIPPADPDWVRRTFFWSDAIWEATRRANAEIMRQAAENGLRVIDLASAVDAASGPLAGHFSEDTLHWNAAMYARLNEVLVRELFAE